MTASVPSANEPVSPFYIPASAAVGIARANVLKHGDCFAILDLFGNAQATGPAAEGLFFEDTRYLSQLALTIDGMRPLLLSSSVSENNDILEADLTNPDLIENGQLRSPRDTVHILSRTTLGDAALLARLELRNFALTPARFRLAVHVDADFVDIFELRGTVRRRRGRLLRPEQTHDGVVLAYIGRDRVIRRMRLVADPAPHWAAPRRLEWTIMLAPGDTATIQLAARCERSDGRSSAASRKGSLAAVARRAERERSAAAVTSSNELFNGLLGRSRADLDMLVTTTSDGLYAYAGIPWFSTAFGRDGLITALECLWLDPALAAGTLRFLAARQARMLDPRVDAEPGKILHETRKGEMAMLGEVPFRCYYGSVDATPLFVVLAAAYHARTGDLEFIRSLWPNVEAALAWMADYGDVDGDGFIEYDRKSANGLANQGWKDSGDAIFHADGRGAVMSAAESPWEATSPRRGAEGLTRLAARGPAIFLWHYVRRRLARHLAVLAAVLAAVSCAVGSQYAVKNLVDVLVSGDPSDWQLWSAVAVLLGLVAGDNLLWRLGGWIAASTFVAVGGDLRLDLFAHLSGHGSRYFADRFPGALAGRVTTVANAAWTIESSLTWTTIPPASAVLISIGMLGAIDWRITAVLLVIVAILSAIIAKLASRRQYLHHRFAGRAAAVSGSLTDVVANIGLVRAFGAARREQMRLSQDIAHEMLAQRESLLALERLRLFHAFAVFLVTAGILAWSVSAWRMGLVTAGDVVLTTSLGFTVLHASRDLAMAMVDLVQHFAKLGEAVQVLGLPHEMEDAPGARLLICLGGSVALLNVCFSYPDGERVLQDFTLHVPAGQKLGLVGRSGAGKSTLLALVQRLYDPESGHVLIDEQDVSKVTQESLRRAIAVVQQDISLFHRSLLENLRYGRPDATDAEVRRAAAAARYVEFIEHLPQGYDTIVGERGLKLSGGQRQRLAIARAFLRDSPIILLDEATSALDSESEQSVQEALAELMAGRTVVAIAHRLSTLSAFDRIVVLERGRVIEDGAPAELLRRKGFYSRMVRQQVAVTRGE